MPVSRRVIIPAKAGIQKELGLDSRFRGNCHGGFPTTEDENSSNRRVRTPCGTLVVGLGCGKLAVGLGGPTYASQALFSGK